MKSLLSNPPAPVTLGVVHVTALPQTAQTKAAFAAEQQRMAAINSQLQAERTQMLANQADPGMKLADVAQYSPGEAKNALDGVEKLISLGGADRWRITGLNDGASTTSLSTYAEWLRDRAGAASPASAMQKSLISVTA